MSSQLRAHIAMGSVAVIYGINYFITKLIVPELIGPFGAILIRVFFGSILFILVHHFTVKEKVEKQDYWKLALAGLFGVALNQLMFFKGLSITSEVNAALMMTTTPILVLVISAIVLGEKITVRKIIGILMGATGAVLLISGKDFSFSADTLLGDIFILINATSYGIYLILAKPLMKKYQALTVVRWTFSFGFLIIIPFGIEEFLALSSENLTMTFFSSMGYIILFTTFLAYLMNAWALKIVNPSVVGFYIYLQPILATFFSIFLGKDIDILMTLILSSLIFTGVYLVSK